jgi:hypothetical protein
LAHGIVAPLANIRDIGCGELRALSQNRASASRVSSCYGLLGPQQATRGAADADSIRKPVHKLQENNEKEEWICFTARYMP